MAEDKSEFTHSTSDDNDGSPSTPPANDLLTAPPPASTATDQVNNQFINPGYQATPPQQNTTTFTSEQQKTYSAQPTYSATPQQTIIERQPQLKDNTMALLVIDDDDGSPSVPPATDFTTTPPQANTDTDKVKNEFTNIRYQATPRQQNVTTFTSERQRIYSVQPTYSAPPQQTITERQPQVQDHTNMALFVTICWCLPFGLVGLLKANEAKNLLATGNYEAAGAASTSAGKWIKAGLIFGEFNIIMIIAMIVVILAI